MIEITNFSFRYQSREKDALDHINLEIKDGEFVLLLGASGCGKTTVTRLINGLIPEFYEGNMQGNVIVEGKNTREVYVSELSADVGSVFQDPSSQFFTTDTTSELVFSCENQGMKREQIADKLEKITKKLDIEELLDRNVFRLSSGEKQMIAIGSVSAYCPKVLVFDEPSANLDGYFTQKLYDILKTLKQEGYTIIVAEHKIHYLKELCDRAILFEEGKIKREYSGDEFRKLSNNELNKMGLRSSDLNNIEVCEKVDDMKEEISIEIEKLNFSFHNHNMIFKNFNTQLSSGKILGIIGENGRGKTTFLELLCGLRREKSGAFLSKGMKLNTKQRQKDSYLVMQTSEFQLFSDSVVGELCLDNENMKKDEKLLTLLKKLKLEDCVECHPMSLSGGQKQRLCIAVACYKNANVICLDEPTSGLDYVNMMSVNTILRSMADEGKTVIVVTHDYEFLMNCCDEVMYIRKDGISEKFDVSEKTKRRIYGIMSGIERKKNTDKTKHTAMQLLGEFIKPCVGKEILAMLFATISVAGAIVPYYAAFQIFNIFFHDTLTEEKLLYWALVAGIGFLVRALGHSISTCIAHISAYTILENMRNYIANKLIKAPLGNIQSKNIGKLKSLIVDNVETLELPFAHIIPEGFAAFVLPIAVFVYMCCIDYRLALISIVSVPLGMLPFMGALKDFTANYDRQMKTNEYMNSVIVEYVEGIEVVKAFNQTTTSYEKLSKAVHSYYMVTMDWFQSVYKSRTFMNVMMPSTSLGVLPLGIYLYIKQDMDPAVILISILLSMGIVSSLMKFTLFMNDMKSVTYSIESVIAAVDDEELVEGSRDDEIKRVDIKFEDVNFAYNDEDGMVLSNVNIEFEEGKYYALVGPSGGGKSTIARLIARYWDVNNGQISIGGIGIKEISLAKLSQLVSFVTQDNYLFNTTIFENIKMGNGNATDTEVLNAAKLAMCDEFISKLENGYHSMAGEAGTKLSGGERQRIALARAILKDAPIVILDEATAFTDPENEAQIQASITELTKGKTLIVIAHRLSTIKEADKILLINQGEVECEGTHSELLDNSERYKKMWEMHINAKNWGVGNKHNIGKAGA